MYTWFDHIISATRYIHIQIKRSTSMFFFVTDPPKDSKIEFDAVDERCFCRASGNPHPSYVWLWFGADGRKKVVSTNQYLDMTSFPGRGLFRFRCIVSNTIRKTQYTSVLEIRMHVSSMANFTGKCLAENY